MFNQENVYRFSFGKPDDEPFTDQELAIIQEWESGEGEENWMVDIDDPEVFQKLALYIKYKASTEAIYKEVRNDQRRI